MFISVFFEGNIGRHLVFGEILDFIDRRFYRLCVVIVEKKDDKADMPMGAPGMGGMGGMM